MILYIETNFLVGAALGRDRFYERLLNISRDDVRICLPDVCIMEAFSTLSALNRSRNRFGGELERQANELRRLTHSAASQQLLEHLEKAILANSAVEDEVTKRLWRLLAECSEVAAGRIHLLPVDWRTMHDLTSTRPMEDATDGLILAVIRAYSTQVQRTGRGIRQAMLTGNTKDFDSWIVRDSLTTAGVTDFHASTEAFLHWFANAPSADIREQDENL